jgi:uncharacterized membrane protein HdeD (DUF308 family)
MTEPQTGPATSAGQPGGSGLPSGPPADTGPAGSGDGTGQAMGARSTSADSSDMSGSGASSTGRNIQESTGSDAADSGTESNPSTGNAGVTTARRTSASQASVPEQYDPQSGRHSMEDEEILVAGPSAAAGGGMLAAAAGASWAAVLLGGLGMIAVGVILLVWPHATLTVVAILIGAALVVSGLVKLYEGFTARGETGGMRAAYVVIGILAVLAGLYCLKHHALSIYLVAFVTGVYFIVHGLSDIGVGVSAALPGRGVRIALGIFSLAAGIIMIVWPALTLVLLLTIVAAWLIFYGLVLCGLAFSLHRFSKRAGARTTTTSPTLAATGYLLGNAGYRWLGRPASAGKAGTAITEGRARRRIEAVPAVVANPPPRPNGRSRAFRKR